MDNLKLVIGRRIKAARIAKGLSQEQLAAAIGRSVHAVSQIERGVNMPSVETLMVMAPVLGKPMEALVSDQGAPVNTAKSGRRQSLELSLLGELEKLNDRHIEALIAVARSYTRT